MALRIVFALVMATLFVGCGNSTTQAADDVGVDAAVTDGGGADAGGADTGTDAGAADAGGGDTGIDGGGTDAGRDGATARVPVNHRPDDSACQAAAPPGNCSIGSGIACSSDSDCTGGASGRCNMNMGGAAFCRCTYDTCAHDTDCPTGQTCACHGSALHADSNVCLPGNCRVDSDCGVGGFCSPSIAPMGCGGLGGYYCHTAADTCIDDADCSGSGIMACEYIAASSRWECMARLFCP